MLPLLMLPETGRPEALGEVPPIGQERVGVLVPRDRPDRPREARSTGARLARRDPGAGTTFIAMVAAVLSDYSAEPLFWMRPRGEPR